MTKLKDSAILDTFIHNLSAVYELPAAVLQNSEHCMLELDMGCGKGSFTTELAKRHPERLILAADVLSGRLRKLVKRNQREGVENMRVLKAEGRMLIARLLPDGVLDRLHILCPDPWPKDRHSGNRLLTSDFMTHIHRVLKDNGVWHFSTDDLEYLAQVRQAVKASQLFVDEPERLADIADIKTDFEVMWNAEGKAVYHHAWVKQPLPRPEIGH
ncbi:MAG: methyltransferase domain-containing protein [Lentisphaerae bacterium]|nr:methyltransferase domain-containing protein [Lentisphaerota bacterium]